LIAGSAKIGIAPRSIRRITMTAREMLMLRRDQVLAAAARHHASNVRIFGSASRGAERPDSDLDFLVDFDGSASLFDLIELQRELEALLGRRADVVTPDGISPFLRERILAEAQPL
jgi:predicted nucleotidyltransferase